MDNLKRVCMVGSGNFACAIVRNVAENVQANPQTFVPVLRMWTFEEEITDEQGKTRKLTELINEHHENVKYLPGIKLPENILAEPDLSKACEGADILIFCMPHQFLKSTCEQIRSKIRTGAVAVSLIKGFQSKSDGDFSLITDLISDYMGIPCYPMMGANLANEVAEGLFSEATIGCPEQETAQLLKKVFQTKNFKISICDDPKTVEMCGALKNIVAFAAGMIDGLGMKNNTKASVVRLGLIEMIAFVKYFYPDTAKRDTFFESCGIADLMTTCYGGRNRLVGEHFAKRFSEGKTLEDLEAELLAGQKLQGTLTAAEVYVKMEKEGIMSRFPLFAKTHEIVQRRGEPMDLIKTFQERL